MVTDKQVEAALRIFYNRQSHSNRTSYSTPTELRLEIRLMLEAAEAAREDETALAFDAAGVAPLENHHE